MSTEPKLTTVDRCSHHSVTLDSHRRLVECNYCSAMIDPFDHMMTWAKRETHQLLATVELRKEAEAIAEQIKGLKKERASEKSKLDRLLIAQNEARKGKA